MGGNNEDGKEGLRPISLESDEMDDVFTPLEKSLGEDGITLMRTAGTLTLQGEFVLEHFNHKVTFQSNLFLFAPTTVHTVSCQNVKSVFWDVNAVRVRVSMQLIYCYNNFRRVPG